LVGDLRTSSATTNCLFRFRLVIRISLPMIMHAAYLVANISPTELPSVALSHAVLGTWAGAPPPSPPALVCEVRVCRDGAAAVADFTAAFDANCGYVAVVAIVC